MKWLNYNHLQYFWVAAREGGIARAGRVLHLSHPTISTQIHALELALGEKLFQRAGRRLELTEIGRVVYQYADEIFSIGQEIQYVVQGRASNRSRRVNVGIVDAMPKLVAYRLLEPARRIPEQTTLVCREDHLERLLAELVRHTLDVVLSDSPVPPGSGIRAFNHVLGECDVGFYAAPRLVQRFRRGFPDSLNGAPMILPTANTALRRSLNSWFETLDVRPVVVAEVEDSALLKVFGQDGQGVFPAPMVVDSELRRRYGVGRVGATNAIRESFYAISIEKRLRHPAVLAITRAARNRMFRRNTG